MSKHVPRRERKGKAWKLTSVQNETLGFLFLTKPFHANHLGVGVLLLELA
jgi:hypothetical protein